MTEIDPTEGIQWGTRITLPTGAVNVEIGRSPLDAGNRVDATNRVLGQASAQLVYRTAKYGHWQTDQPGDEWGVRYTWPTDGHVEVRLTDSRYTAGCEARLDENLKRGTDPSAQVVSRTAEYGDWQMVNDKEFVDLRRAA